MGGFVYACLNLNVNLLSLCQLEAYLMRNLEEFYAPKSESQSECPEPFVKQVATVVGLQPHHTHKLWVVNGQIHMQTEL